MRDNRDEKRSRGQGSGDYSPMNDELDYDFNMSVDDIISSFRLEQEPETDVWEDFEDDSAAISVDEKAEDALGDFTYESRRSAPLAPSHRPSVPPRSYSERRRTPAARESAKPQPDTDSYQKSRVNPDDRRRARVPETRKKSRFYHGLFLAVFIALVIIGAGLTVFWKYMDSYEKSRPENLMDIFIADTNYQHWEEGVKLALTNRVTYFESEDEVLNEVLIPALQKDEFSYRKKAGEYTEDAPVYSIRLGAVELGRVELTAAGSAGFGFDLWKISDLTLLDSFFDAYENSLSITASQNALVRINGLDISESYLVPSEVKYALTYNIDSLYADVEVEVWSESGEKLEPYFAQNGQYLYPIELPELMYMTITAPSDATVYVGGLEVDRSMVGDTDATGKYFGDVLDVAQSIPQLVTYDYEGLASAGAKASAKDAQGRELSLRTMPDGELLFTGPYSLQMEEELTDTVESFIRAYVNYTSNTNGNITTNFSTLSQLMLSGSELYERIKGSQDAMIWVNGATVEYNSLDIRNFTAFGDDCFTCEVEFDITNKTHYETRQTKGNYELTFVLSSGKWVAARMAEIQGN